MPLHLVSLFKDFVWFESLKAFCMLSHSLWVHICFSPIVSKWCCFLVVIYGFFLLYFFSLHFYIDPRVFKGILIKTSYLWLSAASLSFYLYCPVAKLWVIIIYYKKTSLMSVDGYTDLEAQDMSLRVLSLLCFFSEIIVVVFPLKPMGIAKFSGSF